MELRTKKYLIGGILIVIGSIFSYNVGTDASQFGGVLIACVGAGMIMATQLTK